MFYLQCSKLNRVRVVICFIYNVVNSIELGLCHGITLMLERVKMILE